MKRIRNCRDRGKGADDVMRALVEAMRGRNNFRDPMLEQLKQCPEAFKAGEILGRAFDSLQCRLEEEVAGDRFLPPSGTVIPPLV